MVNGKVVSQWLFILSISAQNICNIILVKINIFFSFLNRLSFPTISKQFDIVTTLIINWTAGPLYG